jgi:hypothetical protein
MEEDAMLDTIRILTTLFTVVALPLAGLTGLLLLVGRRERRRDTCVARQVALTDAIHRQLGAVVAPVVTRRLGGGWRVSIAVPFESPMVVARVVAIVHGAMAHAEPAPFDVVLTAQVSGEPRIRPVRSGIGNLSLAANASER